MSSLATTPTTKTNLSVSLDFDKKQALENFAKKQNRSIDFVVLEMIDKILEQAKEQSEYDDWVEQRVMTAYNRVQQHGSSNRTSKQVLASLQEKMNAYAKDSL